MILRKTRMLVVSASVLFPMVLIQGCLIDTEATKRAGDSSTDGTAINRNNGLNCHYDMLTGCIEASIPAAPEVTVNGKSFFDANDLSSQFEVLLKDAAPASQVDLINQGGQIEFQTRIDNRAFHKGFQIYVKGESARSADALATGGFLLHRLPEGAYSVRVQKLIRYRIKSSEAAAEVAQKAVPGATEGNYCATLYAEANVEVRAGERLKFLFDDYELRISPEACSAF